MAPVSAHSHGTSDFASHLGSEPQFPFLLSEAHVSATQVEIKRKDYIRRDTPAPRVLCTVPGTNWSGCPMTSDYISSSERPLPV